jgi:hypothetical protein
MNTEISKLWEIVATGPDAAHELRALNPQNKSDIRPKIFHFSKFPSLDEAKKAFEDTALARNKQGYNIYTTLNPIKSDFEGKSAGDIDIAFRNLLLIDIDRTGDTKQPATDQDIQNAKDLADEVMAYLSGLGWPPPTRVMSGNGHHLYYALDALPNSTESKVLISQALKGLAKKFNNENVSIDTNVSNASRITKVPGTIMRKGEESSDRPYRMAVVL